ncbi:PAS domain-containing protein [Pyxidicoccus fallax]|uniref:histidine kinase n=1 Tax=Pyxidicoccus fallax TaxID=394095 RepID=A0A848LWV9_9BACT|nr:ATP-binding protein [Pyxidicoccus fallax]NMO21893.1 PAS domain-containing protein [Pyxidicoccus fallax]NPC84889.1 PAS domain-containing protein [Pyxidicoccus fallax]
MSGPQSHPSPEAGRPASARLRAQRDIILGLWMDRVRQALPAAGAQQEFQLLGSLPRFLDVLVTVLAPEGTRPVSPDGLDDLCREHGEHRSGLGGYSLQQLLREYQLLREVLFQVLEREGPITHPERDRILAAIEQGMAEAGARFIQATRAPFSTLHRATRTGGESRWSTAGSDARDPRSMEEQLSAARQELQEVFLQAPTPMVVMSGPEHRFTLANPLYEALVKRRVLGKTLAEVFSEEELARMRPLIREVYETGEPHVMPELPIALAEEAGPPRQLYLNISYTPLKDIHGATRAVTCLMVDVTEQVEARRAIEESEARFRQIANALPQIIWTATADFHVDWYNDWWYRYLGLPRGTRWDDVDTLPMHPEDVERTRLRLRESVETGNDFLMEQRFRRGSDGQYRWHLVRGVPIRDSEGRITKWIGANTDIHEQKTLTARLEEEHDLREKFVATLTHDLRTPLTAAKLNAQMVARKASDPNALYKLSARIIENLDRADQMIRDLLDANRFRAGEGLLLEVSECELTALTRETLEELALVHGDRFVLEAPGPIQGHWSCGGLRRILENLCNNAIKYGARDHGVTVTLAEHGADAVSLSVHNWGNPIPPEDQKLLFQQYRRLDSAQARAQKGWGLGLTLVEGLAQAHRGSVRVDSTRETGTTFTVTLARDLRP